jgi:lysozyme
MIGMQQILEQLEKHEGLELKPYRCTSEKLTIGIGRNLEDVGISKKEAYLLLENDVKNVDQQIKTYMPWATSLNPARYAALINFVFNVGIGTALKFENAMAALKASDFGTAAEELLDSRWAKQVGKRSTEISEQIRTGEWQ